MQPELSPGPGEKTPEIDVVDPGVESCRHDAKVQMMARGIDNDFVTANDAAQMPGIRGVCECSFHPLRPKAGCQPARRREVQIRNQDLVFWMRLEKVAHNHPANRTRAKDDEASHLLLYSE